MASCFTFSFIQTLLLLLSPIVEGVQNHLIITEGKSQLVPIETSAADIKSASTRAHLVTIQEYEQLLKKEVYYDKNAGCTKNITMAKSGIFFGKPEVLLSDLDPAEEIDLKERGYKISFDSGISSLIVEVNDDDQYEDNEFCIMLIGDDAQCAMLVEIRDNDDLSFYWSALLLNVYEDEGTVDSLSIIKNGSSEVDVSLEVVVVTKHDFFEAERGVNFELLQTSLLFDSEATNISVPFVVYNITGVFPKHFYLSFNRENNGLITDSNEARINIINRVKFLSQPYNVTTELGVTVLIPCSKAREGAEQVALPHWIIRFSNGTTVTPSLPLPVNHVPTLEGLNVTVKDIALNLTSYTCYYEYLFPESGSQFISRTIMSDTGILTISNLLFNFYLEFTDDWATNKVYGRSGENIGFSIIKNGTGDFIVNVTINSSDQITINQSSFIFDRDSRKFNGIVSISNNLDLNNSETFIVTITEPIEVIEGENISNLIAKIGEPLLITVYANHFHVGFAEAYVYAKLTEKSTNYQNICIILFEPDEIDPSINILLSIEVIPDEEINLENEMIILNSTNKIVCFDVAFIINDHDHMKWCKGMNFTLQLTWNNVSPKIFLTFYHPNITVAAKYIYADCTSPTVPIALTIIVCFIIAVMIVLVVTILIICMALLCRHCAKKKNKHLISANNEQQQ